MNQKRITLLCGHYGSGKTNIAVNLALLRRKTNDKVAVADLDIVNPYFRSKDSSGEFAHAGIRLICSDYANTNLDIPALPQDMYAIVDDKSLNVIMDIGGEHRGALALGRIAPAIKEENDYEMLLVVNCYRPLTKTADDTIEVMHEIEAAGHIPFTGIVNNSNLGEETDAQTVLDSMKYAAEISEKTGLPLVMTAVHEKLYDELKGKIPDLFPLHLQPKF